MNHSLAGLVLFVAVQALNLAGLGLDLVLLAWRLPTITEHVWETPWLGVPIVLLQVVGATGLAWHFWGSAG